MISLPIPEPPTCPRLNSYGGYTSNMRGVLSYSTHLDKLDNPGMIPVLQNAYNLTTTHKDYLKNRNLTGKECLPAISVSDSGFTHTPLVGTSDYRSIQIANKEKVNSAYYPKSQLTPCCLAPEITATETQESYSTELLNSNKPAPVVNSIVGEMESGFTRNIQPNPTDGRVLDPIYLGQLPALGKFGPSVTHMDYTKPMYLSGKEPNQPLSRKTDKHSGFWQEKTLPACFSLGTRKNYCNPTEDFLTCYRLHYPKRWCDNDYAGFTLSGKPQLTPGIKADVNLFDGKGYYISETMESFSEIPKRRVQIYPTLMAVNYNNSIFPKPPICPPRSDCPDDRSSCVCPTKVKLSCQNNCTI
ncbi:unnamed protein product [Allacma fusca]|uniref:Uncharacterized protein n=1 Tax=Allacma fusca TaxID=39272 RepID=A0A8J2MCJ7_9HEXA|nr:unnamed protein product [Allacma fusca]CAG7836121.1 unnamed protein product [Allacma fusca]